MLQRLLESQALAQPVMWYNDEEHFQSGVAWVIDAKRAALTPEKRLSWLIENELSELPSLAESISRLLREPQPSVRTAALQAYQRMPPEALTDHVQTIVTLLRDSEEDVRLECCRTLGCLNPVDLNATAPTIALTLDLATQARRPPGPV